MSDRVFFAVVGLIAAGMIALALVWPEGLGRPSPPPFGHPLAPPWAPSEKTQPPARPATKGPLPHAAPAAR